MYNSNFVVVGGDYNLSPHEWMDRCPSRSLTKTLNPTLFEFINSNHLVDVWRDQNPGVRQFTWIKPNESIKSRIDLWLTTPEVIRYTSHVSISSAPLTDHCVISLKLNPANWKTF